MIENIKNSTNLQNNRNNTVWLTPSQVQEIYGVSESTQMQLRVKSRQLNDEFPIPFFKFGKTILYKKSELDEWMSNFRVIYR
ncbi:helix-turn-helix domain-containing protein [Campylobacter ureolyticus]|uniref:helix-turn-helix domain-containing protein n=1 Tax=Campylobacter ureolyticus TaxID=827 RepID=UPI002906B976|nr:helix-turn-helix domain-containing protein [Campylobacter ureolyticus]MDU7071192.1 helix-turn-helix domain-containing protein [Campylobacter ureolyticus]